MRIRPIWFVAAGAALAGGCANAAEPRLVCDGNPKCEAHPTPVEPSTLEPLVETTSPADTMRCSARITARCR